MIASGGAASIAAAGCLGDDEGGDDDAGLDGDDTGDGDDGGGAEDGDDSADDGGDDDGEQDISNVEKAQQAWDRVVESSDPENDDVRNEAYIEMEEGIRDDMILMPLFHGLSERFWYDWVEIDPPGPLGGHHQQYHEVTIDTGHDQKDENVLQLINSTVSSLDPIQSTDTASGRVVRNAYEGLTVYPAGVTEMEHKLAEDVEVSDDLRTYTVTIKEASFHDGEELTADDFVYNWRRLAESPNSERANFILDPTHLGIEAEIDEEEGVGPMNVVPDSMELEAVDDRTLEFTLSDPTPGALDILTYDSFAAVPEGYVDDLEDYDGEVTHDEFTTSVMNGTGPFEFVEWESGSHVDMERFDDYHDGAADIDAVHWEIIEDDDAIWTYVNERNADVFGIPTAHYDRGNINVEEEDEHDREIGTYGPLDNGDTVNYSATSDISTYYFGFNGGQTEREIRQAVAYVTDHEELVEQVFEGRGVPAFSFIPPALWPEDVMAYDDWVNEWPYSPNETDRQSAEEIVQDAGYSEEDPYELTLVTYESVVFQEAAELTRDKLAGTGVEFEIDSTEFADMISRGYDGDLQMFTLGWIWSWTDIAYGMYGFEPDNTDTDRMPEETNGYMIDWDDVEE